MAGAYYFKLDASEIDRLQNAIKNFPGDAEKEINAVLHGEGSVLIQDAVRRLMPVSGVTWRGKGKPAKTGNSLTVETGNLYVIVKSSKKYQYLYFPNDGTSTQKHAGEQHFFWRGAESQQAEIIDRCIAKLIPAIENKL